MCEFDGLRFFLDKQPIVGTEPRAILWIGARVVWETTDADVASDSSQIPTDGVNDVENFSIVCEFNAGDHHDAAESGGPVVVADETAFAGAALSFCDFCHSETDVWGCVEGGGVEYGYSVPA